MNSQPVLKLRLLAQLLRRVSLLLTLCYADIVHPAPVVPLVDEPGLLRELVGQQVDTDRHYDLSITPSGSFLRIGQTVYYAQGLDLGQGIQSVLEQVGSELGRSTLINIFLQLTLLIHPVLPVYGLSTNLVSVYRLQRLLNSWLILGGQLWSWLRNNLSDLLWPERHYEQFNLSSADTGTVILELVTNKYTGQPVEQNIYLTRQQTVPDGLLVGNDSGFDGFIRWLQNNGIYQWRMRWLQNATQVEHQLFYFHKTEPDRFDAPFTLGIDISSAQPAAIANRIAILNTVLSGSFLQCLMSMAGYEVSPFQENGHRSWSGEYSGFVPLDCADYGSCQGLYLIQNPLSGQVISRRIALPYHPDYSTILQRLDNPKTALALGAGNTAIRLPEWVVILALELLEEMIEAVGYKATDMMIKHFNSVPVPTKPVYQSPGNRAEDLDDPGTTAVKSSKEGGSSGYYLFRLAKAGDESDLEDLAELTQYASVEQCGEAFKVALQQGHHRHVGILYKSLPDSWLKGYIRDLIKQPDLTLLEDLAKHLPGKYIRFTITQAINAGLPGAVEVMRSFATIPLLTDALYLAIARGRLDIVRLLVPGKSRTVLLSAIIKSHRIGFVQVTDYLIDLLDSVEPGTDLPFPVLKQSFIRALEMRQFERVRQLLRKMPDKRTELLRFVETQADPVVKHLVTTKEDQLAVFRSRLSDLTQTGASHFQLYFKGLDLDLKYQLLEHLYSVNKMELLTGLVNTLDDNDRLDLILDLGRQPNLGVLRVVMHHSDYVTRDQALLKAVVKQGQPHRIKALAELSSLSSIYRGWIIARKSGHYQAAALLRSYLPEHGLERLNYPAYHYTMLADKETVRAMRNHQLNRARLGKHYYIYHNQGKAASRLYVLAHGLEHSASPVVQHRGPYRLKFVAPDRYDVRLNHILLFLEHDFRTRETVLPGGRLKEYTLSKNYNSGWAFNEMANLLMTRDEKLLERKATPFVTSGLRKVLADDGEDMDILTVRGKRKVYLSHLLETLNRDKKLHYREVLFGICRGKLNGFARDYHLNTPITQSYLSKSLTLFVDTSVHLKLHPALSHTVIWDRYSPNMDDTQKWLGIMSRHGDRVVQAAQKKITRIRDRLKAGR